jgi:hypothetical protein
MDDLFFEEDQDELDVLRETVNDMIMGNFQKPETVNDMIMGNFQKPDNVKERAQSINEITASTKKPRIDKENILESSKYTAIPQSSFSVATCSNGTKLYFPKLSQSIPKPLKSGQHLNTSVYKLMEHVQRETKVSENLKSMNAMLIPEIKQHSENSLWVDKYRPKLFVDLIGDQVK